MQIENMQPMVPNSDGTPFNPFNQDSYHMGVQLGSNVTIMMENFENSPCKYLIVINTITGERKRITF